MRSSIIFTSVLATLALANPLEKRYLTTKVEVYTVWTTVTKGNAAATGYDQSGGRQGGRRHRSSSAVAEPPAVPTDASIVVPAPTSEPMPSSEEAPIPTEEPAPTSNEAPLPSKEPAPTSEAPVPTAVTPGSKNGVSTSAAAPAASSPATSSNVASSYGQKILDQHNIHRDNHTDTGPLTWSDALAATALKIANSCVYEHDTATDKSQYNNGQGYGQNIGAGAPAEAVPAMITNGMYNDEAPAYEGLYGQDNPDMTNFHEWGHFTQIVWRNTKQVGCATVQCGTLQNSGANVRPYFTVCNYAPPGNYGGEYTNVGKRLGKAPVSIKSTA